MTKWLEKDIKYIWHPYTQIKDYKKIPPILIKRAKGLKLFDEQGRFYYDTISSWWCNVHGHNHPMIISEIKKQLDKLDHVIFAGFTHKPAVLLARKLVEITPENLTRVFFSDNGSTAVEVALKMSFQYWQNIGLKNKKLFVSLKHGYHGDTIGTMSVSGVDLFNKMFKPLFFRSIKVPSPYCYRCAQKKTRDACRLQCLKPLEKLLSKKHRDISGLILEPLVMCAGGMIVYPEEYLKKAGVLARKYKIHLIVDEVATGFGRTGRMFACDHINLKPDFMCLSKGITGGTLPLGATLTTNKIQNAFIDDYEKKKTFYHGHTFSGNPIACAAALGSLKIFEKEKPLKRIQLLVSEFHKELEKFRELSIVGDVRYIGMIGAVELVKNKKTKESFGLHERIGMKIFESGLKEHLILRPLGSIIYLFLPLCTEKNEIRYIMDKTYRIVQSAGNIS
ncbi:MAG: adenosylmethionine--8-amino-7-oxononanoate transaminase [bacterium]